MKKILIALRNPKQLRELVVYFSIAIVGFSTNIGSRIIYSDVFHIVFGVSVVIAYFTGMVVGFTLTKLFAFGARNSGNMLREMIKFTGVSIVAMLVTLVFSLLCLQIFELAFAAYPDFHHEVAYFIGSITPKFVNRELASHLGGTCFGFFANFFGHKFVTFRTTGYWDKWFAKNKVAATTLLGEDTETERNT